MSETNEHKLPEEAQSRIYQLKKIMDDLHKNGIKRTQKTRDELLKDILRLEDDKKKLQDENGVLQGYVSAHSERITGLEKEATKENDKYEKNIREVSEKGEQAEKALAVERKNQGGLVAKVKEAEGKASESAKAAEENKKNYDAETKSLKETYDGKLAKKDEVIAARDTDLKRSYAEKDNLKVWYDDNISKLRADLQAKEGEASEANKQYALLMEAIADVTEKGSSMVNEGKPDGK